MSKEVQSNLGDKNIKVDDGNNVNSPDFNSMNEDLFNKACGAVSAGLAYTAKRYSQLDDEKMPNKNSEKGTFKYDNDKSVHYVS